jgi:hypothetical protein
MTEDLSQLPIEHPLRNTPLVDIGAHYKYRDGKVWQEIKATYGIAKVTYNQLGEAWTKYDIWKATK